MNVDGTDYECERDLCPLRVRVNRKQAMYAVECADHGLVERELLPYNDDVVIRS